MKQAFTFKKVQPFFVGECRRSQYLLEINHCHTQDYNSNELSATIQPILFGQFIDRKKASHEFTRIFTKGNAKTQSRRYGL